MIKIRFGVFETNSSSTHVLVLCPKEKYTRFLQNDNMYINTDKEILCTEEEIVEMFNNDPYYSEKSTLEKYKECYFKNRYEYNHSCDELETFYKEYKLPSGEIIVAFGAYGYDG